MRFDILTIFPEMFSGPLTESIIKRAIQAGLISVHLHDIRGYATDKHRTTDDAPYGGGAGMVMKAEPLAAAIRSVVSGEPKGSDDTAQPSSAEPRTTDDGPRIQKILMSPAGERFTQLVVAELAGYDRLVAVCRRQEAVEKIAGEV